VTAALASAVADSSPAVGKDEPVIVVPEDRDFDPGTLADVMESFAGIDAQVILTGTKSPKRAVAGWTIIDLGSDDPLYCVQCDATIAVGVCDHGVGKRASGDLFG
jgi:hypothetical protein